MQKSKIITAVSTISKALVAIGFTIDVISIVSNSKLSTSQKVAEIVVWTVAVIAMLQTGVAIAAIGLQLLPAMLLAIMAYLVITFIALWLISLIEEQGSAHYINNNRLRFAKNTRTNIGGNIYANL